ncbi:MAG: hypothetical protein HOP16_03630, partial [Acidobacteria bacterium]|nr:hypothetical protein [Acidobacteriota bacterium]
SFADGRRGVCRRERGGEDLKAGGQESDDAGVIMNGHVDLTFGSWGHLQRGRPPRAPYTAGTPARALIGKIRDGCIQSSTPLTVEGREREPRDVRP